MNNEVVMVSKKDFINEAYKFSVIGKNIAVTEAMKNYLLEKLSKLNRFAHHILDISVTLDLQKLSHTVSIVMKFSHYQIKVHATTGDMYSAIDKATDRLIRLVHKYQTKLQSQHYKMKPVKDMAVQVVRQIDELDDINDEIEKENVRDETELFELHEVVSKDTMPLKTLTQEEAIMKFEFSGEPFMIYKSEEDLKLRVLYRRPDEQLGLVQVE
jgi:putative sigma-54 modulation protein